ncbi:MAG: acyltransferase, partial [Gallionellales bacterium CG08_land_8_20_14_0_20_59_87]
MSSPDLDSTQSRIAAQQSAFKVAAIQMASGPKVEGNLNEARRLIADAAAKGAKLVVLPEFFAIMGMDEMDKVKVRETPGQGPIQQFMREQARQHKVWLIGSLPLTAEVPDKVRNSLLVFDESGMQVARYDKIHLFNL